MQKVRINPLLLILFGMSIFCLITLAANFNHVRAEEGHGGHEVATHEEAAHGGGHAEPEHGQVKHEETHGGGHETAAHEETHGGEHQGPGHGAPRHSLLPFLAVLMPLLAALTLPFIDTKKIGNKFTAMGALATFIIIACMYPGIHRGEVLQLVINTGFPVLELSFMADSLSFITGFIAVVVWTLASFYAVEYMHKEHAQTRYNIFSLLSLTGMLGVVFTKNLFTLYIFFELLSVASYVLVIHEETPAAKKAGVMYLFMGVTGGLILLGAIIATYSITGTGDLLKIGAGLKGHPAVPFIFIGYMVGFGVKAGLFPMHIWLPAAHPVAPTPGSALLSGVMIKAGAYGIIRAVVSIIGIDVMKEQPIIMLLLVLVFINIFFGSVFAIKQTEIKRMLAYSSIAQIGYVLLGVALLTPRGLIGGVVHIFNHAIIKGTLFLCAGAFIHQTGLRQLDALKGIGKRMPITTGCFTLASLSMIGFPPFNGFISKWYLALGALQTGKIGPHPLGIGIFALVILLLSSFMNLVYYGPLLYGAWFRGDDGKAHANHHDNGHAGHDNPNVKDAGAAHINSNDDPNLWMIIPMVILGVGTLFFGIFPQFPIGLASAVSKMYFP